MDFHDLFDAKGIFLKTEHYTLRCIFPAEKLFYEALARQDAPAFLPSSEALLAWEELLSEDHLTCSILERETGTFCGFCQLQWVFSDTPELGIDLLPAYHRKGIAIEVLPPFLAHAKMLLKNDHFYSKIKKNNRPSQKLAEAIGGICIGEKNLLPDHVPSALISLAEKEFPDLFFLEYHFK